MPLGAPHVVLRILSAIFFAPALDLYFTVAGERMREGDVADPVGKRSRLSHFVLCILWWAACVVGGLVATFAYRGASDSVWIIFHVVSFVVVPFVLPTLLSGTMRYASCLVGKVQASSLVQHGIALLWHCFALSWLTTPCERPDSIWHSWISLKTFRARQVLSWVAVSICVVAFLASVLARLLRSSASIRVTKLASIVFLVRDHITIVITRWLVQPLFLPLVIAIPCITGNRCAARGASSLSVSSGDEGSIDRCEVTGDGMQLRWLAPLCIALLTVEVYRFEMRYRPGGAAWSLNRKVQLYKAVLMGDVIASNHFFVFDDEVGMRAAAFLTSALSALFGMWLCRNACATRIHASDRYRNLIDFLKGLLCFVFAFARGGGAILVWATTFSEPWALGLSLLGIHGAVCFTWALLHRKIVNALYVLTRGTQGSQPSSLPAPGQTPTNYDPPARREPDDSRSPVSPGQLRNPEDGGGRNDPFADNSMRADAAPVLNLSEEEEERPRDADSQQLVTFTNESEDGHASIRSSTPAVSARHSTSEYHSSPHCAMTQIWNGLEPEAHQLPPESLHYMVREGEVFNNRFVALGLIGVGEYAVVWLAHDKLFECDDIGTAVVDGEFVALKISRCLGEAREAAVREADGLSMAHKKVLECSGAPSASMLRLIDSFSVRSELGDHVGNAMTLGGPDLLQLITRHDFHGIPLSNVRRIVKSVLVALDELHRMAGIVHCDVKPENVLLNVPSEASIAAVERYRRQADPEAPPETATLHATRSVLDGTADESLLQDALLARVADLGSMSEVPSASMRNEDCESEDVTVIQTREYRAPEVLLGVPDRHRGPAVDMWSLACMAFELATGSFLFDPKAYAEHALFSQTAAGGGFCHDSCHLSLMIRLCGDIPSQLLAQGAFSETFFSHHGDGSWGFKGVPLRRESLERHVFANLQKPDSPRNEERDILGFQSFLSTALCLDPDLRPSAQTLLQHAWLS